MKLLVINSGSSSVKFTLFQMDTDTVLTKGIIERIGAGNTRLAYTGIHGESQRADIDVTDTKGAVAAISALLQETRDGAVQSLQDIAAIGHRVVHGGETMRSPVIIDNRVKQVIRDCFQLAPLHNPPNLKGIEACEELFPGVPQVAVFDTAFHAGLPEHAYLYGLPYRLYREDKIRRYGFHGTSHNYVSRKAFGMIDLPREIAKIVTCHLGNGGSITAIDGGCSIDTSMGLTPLEGLVMGTRCGDIDPAIIFHLYHTKSL
ncbi:MAG: acetate/propionate family kinase, partial [Desulfobacterales bacterium]|nr:acetate/propionate family kinase [Desulfobacterales bacterium]